MIDIFQITTMYLIIALIRFFISRKKTLIIIIRLELILLFLFLNILTILKFNFINISPRFYILVLGACEASIILRILIILTRFKGNDMLTKSKVKF